MVRSISPEQKNMSTQIQHIRLGLLGTFLVCLLTGCFAPRSYIPTEYRRATYDSLEARTEPLAIRVDLAFHANGADKPRATQQVRRQVSKILRASRVVSDHAVLTNAPRLTLVINNIANLAEARAKGVGVGLTGGAAGALVTDFYEMTADFQPAAGGSIKKSYKHAIHSTVGAHSAPKDCEPVALETAFERVLEDMLLNLLADLQHEKLL